MKFFRALIKHILSLRAMNEVNTDTRLPPFFYCKSVNDKGGPCHAPGCDHPSGCVPQLKRQQHTKDGKKKLNDQDQFGCTITSGCCGKRHYYEDKCHIKRRESDSLKCEDAERRKPQNPSKTTRDGDKGSKGGGKGVARDGSPNHIPQRRSSAPAAPASSTTADPKKRPQGNNVSPEVVGR